MQPHDEKLCFTELRIPTQHCGENKQVYLTLVRSVAIIHFEEAIKAAINFVMMFVDID